MAIERERDREMSWRCVNEGGKFRVVCMKELPGTRWLDAVRTFTFSF
eukprot:SAG31_NODE_46966_length_252_cov_0.679739_1_plen_46_part_01